MNSIDNLIKTICIILNIDPLDGSYVDALGEYFNVIDQPEKPYNREVLVAALVNGVAPGTSEVLIFDTFADFPVTGDDNTLYVAKDANVIYRYDSSFNTYFLLNDPNIVNPDAPEEGATYYVRLATSAALNACTYNNGTAGVGATLTGNVNGILSQSNQTGRIDATVPVLGNIILVKNQSVALQNGIYEITQLGSGAQPFILTRIDGYNETAEVYPSIVFVSVGSANINRYFTQSTANPTIGVSSLVYSVATVSFPVSTIQFVDTYINVLEKIKEKTGPFTYTNGTVYVTSPGYGATIRANANGALGTVNGVVMTSGRRILINDASTPLLNGDYTVTNAGSATQRWQLTRINYQSGGFLNTVREWYVSNPNSVVFGSRWALTQNTISTSQVGISQAINFSQQNQKGLKTHTNGIYIDGTVIGVSDFSIETDNTVGFGVYNGADESAFQLEVGAISANVTDTTTTDNYMLINNNAIAIGCANLARGSNAKISLHTHTFNGSVGISTTGFNDVSSLLLVNAANGPFLSFNDDDRGFNTNLSVGNTQIEMKYDNGTYLNNIVINNNLELSTDNGNQIVSLDPSNKTIQIDTTDGSNDSYLLLDGSATHKAKLFSTGDVEIIADNGFISLSTLPTYADDDAADADTNLPSGGLYKTVAGGRAVFQKPSI